MIHVIISVKRSERFPGKNRILFPYTAVWLACEMANMEEGGRVWTVGERSELPSSLPCTWEHIDILTGDHLEDLAEAERRIRPQRDDVFVLCQLTQPVHRCGLLIDMVDEARKSGCAISASLCGMNDWRMLADGGKWGEKVDKRTLMLDGTCYAWMPGQLRSVFDHAVTHGVVKNADCIVDIDYKEDLRCDLTTMWGETIIKTIGNYERK